MAKRVPKIKVDKPDIKYGWLDPEVNLTNKIGESVVRIKGRMQMEKIMKNMDSKDRREILNVIDQRMKDQIKWETKMVLQNKLNPEMAHKLIYEHPVIAQRVALAEETKKEKEKRKFRKHKKPVVMKKIENIYYREMNSHLKKLGIEFSPHQLGDSYAVDYANHGKELKKVLYKFDKEIGIKPARDYDQDKLAELKKMTVTKDSLDQYFALADEIMNPILAEHKVQVAL